MDLWGFKSKKNNITIEDIPITEFPDNNQTAFIESSNNSISNLYSFLSPSKDNQNFILKTAEKKILEAIRSIDVTIKKKDGTENNELKKIREDFVKNYDHFYTLCSLIVINLLKEGYCFLKLSKLNETRKISIINKFAEIIHDETGAIESVSLNTKKGTQKNLKPISELIVNPNINGDFYFYCSPFQPLEKEGFGIAVYDLVKEYRDLYLENLRAFMTKVKRNKSFSVLLKTKDLNAKEKEKLENVLRDSSNKEHDGIVCIHDMNIEFEKIPQPIFENYSVNEGNELLRRIYFTFGIPAALANLNASDGSKYASNYEQNLFFFYVQTIKSYTDELSRTLSKAWLPKDYYFYFDINTRLKYLGLYENKENNNKLK